MLALHTRPDLIRLAREGIGGPVPSNLKKRELISLIQSRMSFKDCFGEAPAGRFVVQRKTGTLDYLFFLYYGKLSSGLTALALRDLGMIQRNPFQTGFRSRFGSRTAARAAFTLEKISAQLDAPDPAEIVRLADTVTTWPRLDDPESEALFHRAVYRLGRELERCGNTAEALRVYRVSDHFPATERTARLLLRSGEREAARTELTRMIEDPSCDAELLFAEDLYERKFQQRKVGRLTALLREGRTYRIDETNRDRPEAGVISLLARRGEEAFHAENLIWNQLFGLLLWDLLFENGAPIHNEFERKPWGLDSGKFSHTHRARLEDRLALLDHPGAAVEAIRTAWARHEGTPNALVPWFPGTLEQVTRLVSTAPRGGLAAILRLMAENHRAHRSGFPDLMVHGPEGLRFLEIKTEGDRISRPQLTRLEQLRRAGFRVEVGLVQWTVDPGQEYVVVDIETTGSSAKWNRITEIGAVKLRGEEIVAEWSTLVNPGRRIPKSITALTGITDAMVADAPAFVDVADAFHDFLGDAVFAAHRAAFDYGFLRAEYERIGRDFRCPTLCTVVMARRVFPGLPSYGLAHLCRELGVPLDSHHRALCDAKATAELLRLINRRRIELACEKET